MKQIYFISMVFFVLISGCKKEDSTTSPEDSKVGGSIIYNGYTYHTITIGTQEWTVENLRTISYNDGTAIPNVTGKTEWPLLKTGAYCAPENDESTVSTYGYLYNWYSVNTGKLAPSTGGWRIPTDADWTRLTDFLGSNAGTKLKAKSGWNNNGNGTDDFGFNALSRGGRYDDGGFYDFGFYCNLWSSTEGSSKNAWYRIIGNNIPHVERNAGNKDYGLSVRLVRDK